MKKETTGDRLKKYRKLRKLTQKDVANFLGVKNNTISNWENNINGIDVKKERVPKRHTQKELFLC